MLTHQVRDRRRVTPKPAPERELRPQTRSGFGQLAPQFIRVVAHRLHRRVAQLVEVGRAQLRLLTTGQTLLPLTEAVGGGAIVLIDRWIADLAFGQAVAAVLQHARLVVEAEVGAQARRLGARVAHQLLVLHAADPLTVARAGVVEVTGDFLQVGGVIDAGGVGVGERVQNAHQHRQRIAVQRDVLRVGEQAHKIIDHQRVTGRLVEEEVARLGDGPIVKIEREVADVAIVCLASPGQTIDEIFHRQPPAGMAESRLPAVPVDGVERREHDPRLGRGVDATVPAKHRLQHRAAGARLREQKDEPIVVHAAAISGGVVGDDAEPTAACGQTSRPCTALRTSMVRFTDVSRSAVSRSNTLTVAGEEPTIR